MGKREDVNKSLKELYEEKWDNYIREIRNNDNKINDFTNPYLIKVPEDYCTKDIVVMVYGKAADVWGGENGDNASIEDLIKLYDKYVNIDMGESGNYWNFMRDLRKRCPRASFVFNNLFKMGSNEILNDKLSVNNFGIELMRREIEIIAPDIILFLGSASANEYNVRMRSLIDSDRKEKSLGGDLRNVYELEVSREPKFPLIYSTYNPSYMFFERDLVLDFFVEKINTLIKAR